MKDPPDVSVPRMPPIVFIQPKASSMRSPSATDRATMPGRCISAPLALALAPFTDTLTYLEEGDWVVLLHDKAVFFDASHLPVERKRLKTFLVDKGNHRHFMAKEIHEQPEVVARTLAHHLDMSAGRVALPFEPAARSPNTRQADDQPPAALPTWPG